MYESFYGFREKPFSLVPDPDFLYLGKHHRAALNILEYGLMGEASFALISGEVGSGKTILIRRFLRMVDPHTTVGLITNTHASLGNLLDWILLAFDLDYRGKEKVELFEILTDFLKDQRARGRRTVLIIDEAQNMEPEMLEELRMLSNINVDKDLMFQIVLAGQPEILDKINRPELRQLAQRISANFHLSPLTLDETRDYICHRLAVAGGRRDTFDNLACAAVYYFTEGLPRPINIICDAALVYGFGEERETIGLETILDVVENVQRSGLRALRSLEGGFKREDLREQITELAKTYVRAEPPEDDLEAIEAIQIPQAGAEPAPAPDRTVLEARPTPPREPSRGGEPEAAAQPAPARDVPAGIAPLYTDGSRDGRYGDYGRSARNRKKWRRVLEVAAVVILVLVGAASLLSGLEIWSDSSDPATASAERGQAAGDVADGSGAEEPGLVQQLLSALGLSDDGSAAPNAAPNGTASATAGTTAGTTNDEDPDSGITLTLERSAGADEQAANPADRAGGSSETERAAESSAQAAAPSASQADDEAVRTAAIPPRAATPFYAQWIRLGTFRRPESAPILWRRLQRDHEDLLKDLSYQIAKVQDGGQDAMYVLKAGPLADVQASMSLCRDLASRGIECLVSDGRSEVAVQVQEPAEAAEEAAPAQSAPAQSAASSQDANLYKLALSHSENGQAFSKSGDYDKALDEFNQAIRLNPGLAAAYYNRGEIYFKRGDYAQAIRDFTRTVEIAPDYTFAYYSRGVANEKSGDIEEAILDFTHTVRLKPSYAPAYNDRARAFYRLGHLREALRDSELALSVAPDTPAYLATHSQILAALGRNEGAFAMLEKAMEIANSDWIRKSQQAMSRDGYYRGPIDGRYGPATKSAMRACLVSGCNLAEWN